MIRFSLPLQNLWIWFSEGTGGSRAELLSSLLDQHTFRSFVGPLAKYQLLLSLSSEAAQDKLGDDTD
jgi:hypothetical protein